MFETPQENLPKVTNEFGHGRYVQNVPFVRFFSADRSYSVTNRRLKIVQTLDLITKHSISNEVAWRTKLSGLSNVLHSLKDTRTEHRLDSFEPTEVTLSILFRIKKMKPSS